MSEKLVDLEHGGEAAEMVLGKPPRLLRSSIYIMVGLILTAIVWAYLGTIDIVITAPGVVRPKGDAVKVQSLASGRIVSVKAKEGDEVRAGDLLFVLDGKELQAELDKAQGRRDALEKQLEKLRTSHGDLVQQQSAEFQRDEIGIAAAKGEWEKAKRSREHAEAGVREAASRLREAQDDYDRSKRLAEQQVISQAELQKKENALAGAKASQESAAASLRIAEQEVSLVEQALALKRKQAEISAEERKRTMSDLDSRILALSEEAQGYRHEAEKLRVSLDHLEVRAPAEGTMTSIAFKNTGEVVRSGDTLAAVAPKGVPWIVEALVSNKDAGPLRQKIGGRVKLKFDAFPFRDYGAVEGKLLEVAHDAASQDKLGMVFKVQVGMDSLDLKRGRREGRVTLGMTANAEIVKEEERILFLLFREVRDRVSYD